MAGRCDCAQSCACAFTGSGTVSMSGAGAAAQPFVAAVRRRPGQSNALETFEAGDLSPGVAVYMRVRDANGTPLGLDDQGYVQLPAGAVPGDPGTPPEFGDGFILVGTELVPDVTDDSAWPINDLSGVALAGSAGSFDSFMGQLVRAPSGLHALPDHTAVRAGSGETLETPPGLGIAVTSTYTTVGSTTWSITNPSSSRRMMVHRAMAVTCELSCPVGGKCAVALQQRIQGGAWTTQRTLYWPVLNVGTNAINFDGEVTKSAANVVGPEGIFTVQVRVVMTKVGSGPDPPVFLGSSAACELIGVTI